MSKIDTTSNYSYQHEGKQQQEPLLTLAAAPPLTRFILKWQASRTPFTKVIYALMNVLTFMPFNYIVNGVGLLNSPTIGIVLAIYGPTGCFVWLTQPVISKPGSVFHNVIFSSQSSLHKFNKTLTQQIVGMSLMCCIFLPAVYLAIVIPMLGTNQIFGEQYNDTLLYIFMVSNTVFQLVLNVMNFGGDTAIVMFATVRMNKTRAYISEIKATLLDTELGEKEQLAKLTEEHFKVEHFAREANKGLGATDTAKMFMFSSWVMIFLISAALISTSTSTQNKLQTILVLCLFIVVFTLMALQTMVNITAPSRAWNSACDQELNVPSIQRTINSLFGRREDFDRWLSSHEMATQRLFGVKVNMERIGQVGSLVVSLVAIAVYLIARQELMNVL